LLASLRLNRSSAVKHIRLSEIEQNNNPNKLSREI